MSVSSRLNAVNTIWPTLSFHRPATIRSYARGRASPTARTSSAVTTSATLVGTGDSCRNHRLTGDSCSRSPVETRASETAHLDHPLDLQVPIVGAGDVPDLLQPLVLGSGLEGEMAVAQDPAEDRFVDGDVEDPVQRHRRPVRREDAVQPEDAHVGDHEALPALAARHPADGQCQRQAYQRPYRAVGARLAHEG